jgi:hypothetical protein
MSVAQDTPSHTEALSSFITFCKHDLTSFIHSKKNKHKFRCIVMGGYGLKTVLESKYDLQGKVKTNDLDITVSSYKSELDEEQLLNYWVSKIFAFIRTQPNQKDYKISVIQGSLYVPIMDYTRTAIIMVSYKYQEFVDIAITNAKIPKATLDKPTSLAVGLPVKKLNGYLLELLTIIYRSNVQDVAPEVYEKRNPVTGYYGNKGLNDIGRAKLICQMPRQKKYQTYCELIKRISIPKLFQATAEERDKFFNALSSLVHLRKRIVKKSITSDKAKHNTKHYTL